MESTNPYQSPVADVSARPNADGFDTSSPFSPKGRFGRLSYLAWGVIMYLPLWVISVFVNMAVPTGDTAGAAGLQPAAIVMSIIMVIYMIPMLVAMWIFVIRRLHDFNASGWWSLLLLLPIANFFFGLVLLLRRGNEGGNNFGPARVTRGWERGMGILGVVMMVIALIGIIAAIAIPFFATR